jgi:hypothetical protein
VLWSLNNVEFERLGKEEVVAHFKKPSWKFTRETEENQERPGQVRIWDTPAEVRPKHLPNTNQDCYHLNQLDLYFRVKSISFINDVRKNAMFSVLHKKIS